MPDAVLFALGLTAAVGAAAMLRWAWRRGAPGRFRAGLVAGGWSLLGLSLLLLAPAAGFDAGPVVAVSVLGVAAYVLAVAGIDIRRRGRRTREAATEPLDPLQRPMRWGRATLRCATAVVLAATASIALAAAWSLHGVGSAPDRVVLAAYVLPVVWGAAMTWALCDERLVRPVAGLAILTAAGAALAFLPGAGG